MNIFAADDTTVFFTLANAGSNDGFVVKYDLDGNPLWAKRISGTLNEFTQSVTIDSIQNIIVAGYYSSNPLTFS